MGDRANIVVKCQDEQVCLYTHWSGSELVEILNAAMIRGEDRWHDFPYLTRIIFCEMVKDNLLGDTGYGISEVPHDGEYRVITVDVDKQTVQIRSTPKMSFKEFINATPNWGEE
jgi:hypothetical protein